MRRRMMASIGGGAKKMPTARDYVQDGLIAMWDGIENAGWGMHDAAATVWTDLIGGNNAVIQGAITFGDKCARLRGGVANIDEVLDVNYIEAVFKHGGQSYAQYFKFANPVPTSKYIAVRSNSALIFMQNGDNFPVDKNSLTYVSYDYKNNVCLVDGNQVEKKAKGGSFAADGYGFGVYPYSNCDMYSIRLYSQPLSASAKIANYAIDKERFGLA